jgi:hypothetical protein
MFYIFQIARIKSNIFLNFQFIDVKYFILYTVLQIFRHVPALLSAEVHERTADNSQEWGQVKNPILLLFVVSFALIFFFKSVLSCLLKH